MSASYVIQGGHVVRMDDQLQSGVCDVGIAGGQISAIGKDLKPERGDVLVSAKDCFVIPGLIQAHTHLVQALFRGLADDLELLDWLKKRIWPFEFAHNEASVRASAQIGLLEMQLLGTTSILDMGTTRLHEFVFAEAQRSGMRYWGGNCLMDKKAYSGPLYRSTEETLAYCEKLIAEWHKKTDLLQYAISPRFVISCSEKMMKAAMKLRQTHDLLMHTHASENRSEIELVRKLSGMDNIDYIHKLGGLGKKSVIAHAIHLKAKELKRLIDTETGITHCPSSNLKLASGVAHISEYRRKGLKVALGADGAPCNNMMDPFVEMRLAALLQKPLFGPRALPAQEAMWLATRGGAEVLNAEGMIGSLEVGKQADVVIVERSHPSVATVEDPYSALVYSCSGRDVRDVWVGGVQVVKSRQHFVFDTKAVIQSAREELARLLKRMN
jgi:5-methylthioadenosine/S-adenosylhomocysteine deaminase